MTREEAIKCLKTIQWWTPDWDDRKDGLSYWDAIDMALTALTPPNEPLTQADLNEMYLNEVWLGYPDGSGETALVVNGKIYSTSSLEGAGLDLEDYIMGETLDCPTGSYKVYRRPPEVSP